ERQSGKPPLPLYRQCSPCCAFSLSASYPVLFSARFLAPGQVLLPVPLRSLFPQLPVRKAPVLRWSVFFVCNKAHHCDVFWPWFFFPLSNLFLLYAIPLQISSGTQVQS